MKQNIKSIKRDLTWIFIGDSKLAKIYTWQKVEKLVPVVNSSHHNNLKEITEFELTQLPNMKWEAESAERYEMGRNATGMVFQSSGKVRSMSEPHIDAREEVKNHFAKTIAKDIDRARALKKFNRLFLIAPAKMLGKIKHELNDQTQKLIVKEKAKDFMHFDAQNLTKHLEHTIRELNDVF